MSNNVHWRGIATRYDKHARIYQAGVIVACIVRFWTLAASHHQPGLRRLR